MREALVMLVTMCKLLTEMYMQMCIGLLLTAVGLWSLHQLSLMMCMLYEWWCLQAESLWLHLGIIKELAAMCHSVFQEGDVRYGYTPVPTYPRWVFAGRPLGGGATLGWNLTVLAHDSQWKALHQ